MISMARKYKKETLIKRLEKLKERRLKERQRLHQVIDNYGFGHAMRCSRTTPSFRTENELNAKIEKYERLIAKWQE